MHAELIRIIAMAIAERLVKRGIPYLPFLKWPGFRRLFDQFIHRLVAMTLREVTHCFDIRVADRFHGQRAEFEIARADLLKQLARREPDHAAIQQARARAHAAIADIVAF